MASFAPTPTLLLWLLAMLLLPASLRAQVDAFSIEVAVADRSEPERQSAYSSALRDVLLANSPDKTLLNRDEVRAALVQAEDYVQTYRYRVPEAGSPIPPDTPLTEVVRTSGEATALLLVRFDRERVQGLMSGETPDAATGGADPAGRSVEAGETAEGGAFGGDPFSGARSALVWLLIDEGSRSIRGSDSEASKVRERLSELAGGAGLTLVFPQTDAAAGVGADSLLDSQSIRGFDIEALQQASLRYRADVVLVGHLSRRGADDAMLDWQAIDDGRAQGQGSGQRSDDRSGAQPTTVPESRVRRSPGAGRAARTGDAGWQGEWARLAGDEAERTRTEAEGLDAVLGSGIAWLVGNPSIDQPADYAYGGRGSDTEALVRFSGIASLARYADVLGVLEALPGVERVYPKQASGDAMVFAILPRSALADVADAASRIAWLRRAPVPASNRANERANGRAGVRTSGQVSELARNAELSYDVLR